MYGFQGRQPQVAETLPLLPDRTYKASGIEPPPKALRRRNEIFADPFKKLLGELLCPSVRIRQDQGHTHAGSFTASGDRPQYPRLGIVAVEQADTR